MSIKKAALRVRKTKYSCAPPAYRGHRAFQGGAFSTTSGKGLLSVGFVDVYVVVDAAPRGCGIGGTANVFGA